MTRAEQAANRAYPPKIEEHQKVMGGTIKVDCNSQPRAFFQQGYKQAEIDRADLLYSVESLYSEIDACIDELLRARTSHNTEDEGKALFKMESLMVATLQELSCIRESFSGVDTDDDYDCRDEYIENWHKD